jgi:hypothetical protein
MKNSFKLFLAAAAVVGFASNANAQSSDDATATAYARIISPIEITNQSGLQFGSMVADAGTVTIAPNDARTSTPSSMIVAQGASANAADFTVTGEVGYTFAITLPANGTVTITNGTDLLEVNNFTSSIGLTGTLTGGTSNFSVGGTLTVEATDSTGDYEGDFDVTAAYN